MSTYILGTDDADDVRRFGEEVAPAVRELVARPSARRRAAGGEAAVPRPTVGAPPPAPAPDPPGSRPASHRRPTTAPGSPAAAVGRGRPGRRTAARPAARRTPAQLAVPQHLVDVHDHLRGRADPGARRRRAGACAATSRSAPARSAINTMTMRQNNWTLGAYCESYCRIVTGHHTLEDRSIFPHLRAATPTRHRSSTGSRRSTR